jgi:hypothetical protein
MIDRFEYTPGDGHRYVWRGRLIVVERIHTDSAGLVTFTPTGDTFLAPAQVTATAMSAAVDRWRAARPVCAPPVAQVE